MVSKNRIDCTHSPHSMKYFPFTESNCVYHRSRCFPLALVPYVCSLVTFYSKMYFTYAHTIFMCKKEQITINTRTHTPNKCVDAPSCTRHIFRGCLISACWLYALQCTTRSKSSSMSSSSSSWCSVTIVFFVGLPILQSAGSLRICFVYNIYILHCEHAHRHVCTVTSTLDFIHTTQRRWRCRLLLSHCLSLQHL